MASLYKKAPALPILSWYSKKMGTDQNSLSVEDAARAFFSCVLLETFGATDFDEANSVLYAEINVNREKVSIHINLSKKHSEDSGSYFSYSLHGVDSAISSDLKRIEPKIKDPTLVSGDHVFGQRNSDNDIHENSAYDDRLTDADRALLLPAKWFALAFWAIFGFLLWIPILIRSHVFVSMAIALSALSGTRKDNLYIMIRYANSFWVRGFQNISDFGGDGPTGDRTNIGSALILLVIEASFAFVFYGLIILGLRQI